MPFSFSSFMGQILTVDPAITGDIMEVTITGVNNLYVSLQVSLHLASFITTVGDLVLPKSVLYREMPRTLSSLGLTRNTSG